MYKSQGGQQQKCPSAFMKSYEQNLSETIALLISPRVKVDTSAESYNANPPKPNMWEGSYMSLWHVLCQVAHEDGAHRPCIFSVTSSYREIP